MALKARNLEVLRTIVSIGGVEANHFSLWHEKAGKAVAQPLAGVTDPETGVTFPDLNAKGGELSQTNRILPEPCTFLHRSLPPCSIVRPTLDQLGGAVAIINSFTAGRLFQGQPPKFFKTVQKLAREADAASRGAVERGPFAEHARPHAGRIQRHANLTLISPSGTAGSRAVEVTMSESATSGVLSR